MGAKLDHHIERARRLLAERAKALEEELSPLLFGTNASLWPCTGGYFLWLALPSPAAAYKISSQLAQSSPRVLIDVQDGAHGLRLCFAGMPCDALRAAGRLTGSVVNEVCSSRT